MPAFPSLLGAFLALLALALPSVSSASDDPAPSITAPLAAKSLLLAGDRLGNRVVAVGARGHVLVSDPSGEDWTQLSSPVSSTLTSIDCNDASKSCLIGGHDGVVLNLDMSGEGEVALRRYAPGGAEDVMKPVMNVARLDHGDRVFGAYGLALAGLAAQGEYQPLPGGPDRLVDEEPHMTALTRLPNDGILIAGEFGTTFRKANAGAEWEDLSVDYEGSMFGALSTADGGALLFGLQGKVFRLNNAISGQDWQEIDSGTTNGLFGGVVKSKGAVVLVGANGAVSTSLDNGKTFTFSRRADRQTLSDVVELADGALLLLGEFGATRVSFEEVGQ